jgi:hypothetical protein
MPKKVTELTEEQEKRLIDLRSEWLSIGYSTAPLNRKECEAIIGEFYARIGKPKPVVLFFGSPMMCILAWAVLKNFSTTKLGSQLGSQLRSQLWSQLRSQLGSQLESQLWSQLESQLRSQLRSQLESQLWSQLESQLGSQLESQLWSQLRSQLRSQLWSQLESQLRSQLGSQLESQLGSQLRSQLWSQLRSQLWSQLRSQLRSQLESQLGSQLNNILGGHHWCAWEVFYRFCEEIGVKYAEKDSELLDLWLHQSRHLHWWFPYDGIALASERYTVCKVDAESRLHNPAGQAIGYGDGWGIWAWHGVRVDQRVIEQPETISAKEILAEQNTEVRRVMMERIGMERFLGEAGAKQIHTHEMGDLFSIDLPGDPERVLRAVRVTDPSTGRIYFLRVPPAIKRADDAVAWTFGFDVAKQYRPVAET